MLMGEFWDKLAAFAKDDPSELDHWLEEWKALGDDTTLNVTFGGLIKSSSFAEWRALEATELQVQYLLEDLHLFFRRRIESISTDGLYKSVIRDGRKAMNHIADMADEIGPNFGQAARRLRRLERNLLKK